MGRSRFEGGLLSVLMFLGACVWGLWRTQAVVPGAWAAGSLVLLLLGAALSWRRWLRSASGWLHWREGVWSFAPGAAAGLLRDPTALGPPVVVLDLQRVLLLNLPGAHPRWLWLEQRAAPQAWNAVRRAVHARQRPPATWAADPGHPGAST